MLDLGTTIDSLSSGTSVRYVSFLSLNVEIKKKEIDRKNEKILPPFQIN